MIKQNKDVEEDGRSLRRSRERTCSYAPGRSSTSVSNSRENTENSHCAHIRQCSDNVSNRIGYRDRGNYSLRVFECIVATPLR